MVQQSRHPSPPTTSGRYGLPTLPPLEHQALQLRILKESALIAHESDTTEEGLQRVVDLICAVTGWPVGHIYMIDERQVAILQPTTLWHLQQPHRFRTLRAITEETAFPAGEGLIGQVLASGRPMWVQDVSAHPQFIRTRHGIEIGVRAFCAFPVLVGREVQAVCEFFSPDPLPPDPELLDTMAAVGAQLGRLVERDRLERRIAASQGPQAADDTIGLLRAARQTAAGELADALTHAINSPLFAARTSLALLADDLADAAPPYLSIAREELARIAGMMGRLVRLPRGSAEVWRPCGLRTLIHDTLALVEPSARRHGITIVEPRTPLAPVVRGDCEQLGRALLHLVSNAILAMPAGGTLRVDLLPGETSATVVISDTGPGLPPGIQEHLFEPFLSSRADAPGLGLAVCAHIVRRHGGRIELDPTVQHGSSFRVTLPYWSGESEG